MNTKLAVALFLLLVAHCAAAFAQARPAAPDNLMLWAYVGPGAYVANATVTVTNAQGKQVGSGTTSRAGTLALTVAGEASATAPYRVRTSGGTVDGKPFRGHMATYVPALGFGHVTPLDLITTAAASLSRSAPQNWAANQQRVRTAMGLQHDRAPDVLRLPGPSNPAHALQARVAAAGGFDRSAWQLAAAARAGRPFAGALSRKPVAATATDADAATSTGPAGAPCTAMHTTVSTSTSTYETVTSYATLVGAGMLQLYAGDYADVLLTGVAGFVLTTQNDQSAQMSQDLQSIEDQLTCVSSQVSALQTSVDQLALEIPIEQLTNCIANLNSQWAVWETILAAAAAAAADPDAPGSANDGLNANNANLAGLFNAQTGTVPMAMAQCSSHINLTLFSSSGGATAAWYQLLANTRSQYPNGLPPGAVASLQTFLAYYGVVEYVQAVLTSEYYNYQSLISGYDMEWTAKTFMFGSSTHPCSMHDKGGPVNPSATDYCDWQWNIAHVWPSNTYSDEIAICQSCGASPAVMAGIAVSAVPAALGVSPNTPPLTLATGTNPRTLAEGCSASCSSCNYSLPSTYPANALASFDNFAGNGAYLNPNKREGDTETWNNPRALKTSVASLTDVPGATITQWAPFFNSWLNVVCDGSSCSPGSSTASWQLLSSSAQLGTTRTANPNASGCYVENWHDWVNNGFYSPGWKATNSTTSTVTPSLCTGDTENPPCLSSSFPATPPGAYLLARPWPAGTDWPTPPVVTSLSLPSANVGASYSATLQASDCGKSACAWVATPPFDSPPGTPALPPGLSLDASTGQITGKATVTGSYSVGITAVGTYVLSTPIKLTLVVKTASDLPPGTCKTASDCHGTLPSTGTCPVWTCVYNLCTVQDLCQ